jgi:hypothetical protein
MPNDYKITNQDLLLRRYPTLNEPRFLPLPNCKEIIKKCAFFTLFRLNLKINKMLKVECKTKHTLPLLKS